MGKEGRDEKQVDGQTGAARHERKYQHGNQTAFAALDDAGTHDGWHVTAKTHDERNERFAVQPHFVHHFVHDESRAGHIAGIFHER